MAEDTLRQRALSLWNGLVPPQLASLLSRHQAALITIAFGAFAFSVYHFAGAPDTLYNNFVILADAFLEGHIDIANGAQLESYIEFAVREGKYYVIPPPWPAIMLLPGVAIFGLALNQTLVSAVLGGINTSTVYAITSNLRQTLSTRIWLTVLVAFGTVFWYAAANGGVWYFSHTVAVLFLFFAIYFTLVKRIPLAAGLCLGAAYWTRQPTVLTLPFFVIMFSDLWLKPGDGRPLRESLNLRYLWSRLDMGPLIELGIGVGVFVFLSFIYNYIRFETPLDASQHNLPDRVLAQPWFNHGPFDVRYIPRHVTTAFEAMPRFQSDEPYVLSTLGGMALWATTPAFFYALFNHVRDRRVVAAGIGLIVLICGVIISRAVSALWGSDWATYTFPELNVLPFYGEGIPIPINVLPFFLLMVAAIYFGRRDRLVLACWAAIVPTAIMLATFAGTGFAQFGYRFSLDFMPFLFLLTAHAIGPDMKWHHKLLIVASVMVNLWGVLWVYEFEQHHFLGLTWTTF